MNSVMEYLNEKYDGHFVPTPYMHYSKHSKDARHLYRMMMMFVYRLHILTTAFAAKVYEINGDTTTSSELLVNLENKHLKGKFDILSNAMPNDQFCDMIGDYMETFVYPTWETFIYENQGMIEKQDLDFMLHLILIATSPSWKNTIDAVSIARNDPYQVSFDTCIVVTLLCIQYIDMVLQFSNELKDDMDHPKQPEEPDD